MDTPFLPMLDNSLKDGRYVILRKLAEYPSFTTWLVRDNQITGQNTFARAAKIFSVAATKHEGAHELSMWQSLTRIREYRFCPLYDPFYFEGPSGTHLCLVILATATDLSTYRSSLPHKVIPPLILKPILADVGRNLTALHASDIIHNSVDGFHVMIGFLHNSVVDVLSTQEVRVTGEIELAGARYPIWAVQPFPLSIPHPSVITYNEAELISAELFHLSSAQKVGDLSVANTSTPIALRSPELLLDAEYGTAVDIWAFGCLTFEAITGKSLFSPQATSCGVRLEDDHLSQMIEIAGETFGTKFLDKASRRDEFFDHEGKHLRTVVRPAGSLEAMLESSPVLDLQSDDVSRAAALIRGCTRLDPAQRLSAKDIEVTDWLMDARTPGCRWPPTPASSLPVGSCL